MKRLIIIALIATFSFNCFAQNSKEAKQKDNSSYYNKIENEKIAFFTSQIDLTPEEAQSFWPVYNKFWKDSQKAHKVTMKALYKMRNIEKSSLSEKEIEDMVTSYIKAQDDERAIPTLYYAQFAKVLPIAKVAKLYVAEEVFRMKMINELRKPRKEPRPDADKDYRNGKDDNAPCIIDSDCSTIN